MRGNPKWALVAAIGVIGGLTATLALAGEWDAGAIDKIVVHNDRTISVFKASKLGLPQEDWPNPDACGNASKAILRPMQSVDDVLSGMLSYEQAYAALLGAKLNKQKIAVFLDGCALVGSETYPMIDAVAVVD
jgi:hypothetical protein